MTHEKWEVPSPGGSPGLRLSLVTQERLHQQESSGRGLRKGSSPGVRPKHGSPEGTSDFLNCSAESSHRGAFS